MPAAGIALGTVAGYVGLTVSTVWVRSACLPLSAHEHKWECDAGLIAVGIAYLACSFLAAWVASHHKITSGLAAFIALFAAHGLTPYLSMVFFGERWYQNPFTLYLAVAPALIGIAVATVVQWSIRPNAL